MERKQTKHLQLAVAVLGALLAWPGPSRADAEQPPVQYDSPLFKKLDANRDGFVSRAEANGVRGFATAFSEADENRDGRLSRDEFIKAQSIHDRHLAAVYMDDSVLTAKVKAMLAKDLPASALAISVESYRGHVILSGFLDDPQEARRAREVAAAVGGVTVVTSALQLKQGQLAQKSK